MSACNSARSYRQALTDSIWEGQGQPAASVYSHCNTEHVHGARQICHWVLPLIVTCPLAQIWQLQEWAAALRCAVASASLLVGHTMRGLRMITLLRPSGPQGPCARLRRQQCKTCAKAALYVFTRREKYIVVPECMWKQGRLGLKPSVLSKSPGFCLHQLHP